MFREKLRIVVPETPVAEETRVKKTGRGASCPVNGRQLKRAAEQEKSARMMPVLRRALEPFD